MEESNIQVDGEYKGEADGAANQQDMYQTPQEEQIEEINVNQNENERNIIESNREMLMGGSEKQYQNKMEIFKTTQKHGLSGEEKVEAQQSEYVKQKRVQGKCQVFLCQPIRPTLQEPPIQSPGHINTEQAQQINLATNLNTSPPKKQIIKSKQIQIQTPQNLLFFAGKISVHNLFEWKYQQGVLQNFNLSLGSKQFPIRQISKIKCLTQQAVIGHRKIKITKRTNQEVLFAAQIQQFKLGFPLQYVWFSKIVCSKLIDMGFDLQRNYNNEHKQFNVNITNAFCKGMLYKKSQHLGNWQVRYVVINEEGLFSYKTPNQNYSFSIKSIHSRYIWTRFEIHNDHLIIKIKHGLDKTEFGIPMNNYCQKWAHNWLYAFYWMIMQDNISKKIK